LPFNVVSQFGYDTLAEHLRVDQDLQARYTDYEEMDEFPEITCISGTLRVPNLTVPRDVEENVSGRTIAVKDLYEAVESGQIQRFFVYAINHETKKVEAVEATGIKKTGTTRVLRVIYEDYRRTRQWEVRTTPEHLFMVRDGSYRRASWLRPKDRLMPCTFRTVKSGYAAVYEPLQKTSGGKAVYKNLHGLVLRALLGRDLEPHEVTHHKDEDKTNPHPMNLEVKERAGHAAEHVNSPGDAPRRRSIRKTVAKKWENRAFKLQVSKAHQREPKWLDREEAGLHKRYETQGILSDDHRLAIADGRTIDLAPSVVEAAVRSSASFNEAAKKLGVSWNTIMRRMSQFGFDRKILGSLIDDTPIEGELGYGNHRVVAVEDGGVEDVYDIEVPGHRNFAVGDADGSGFIFVHNSALDLYADDATMPDQERDKSIWVTSDNHALAKDLDDVLHKRLLMENDSWGLTRTVAKYGSGFGELLVDETGLIGINYLPPPTVRRVEGPRGELLGFVQDVKGEFNISMEDFYKLAQQRGTEAERARPPGELTIFEDWELIHWRLRGKHLRSVYGHGVIDGARWIWKRLALLEDALLIYKLCLRGDSRVWTRDGTKAIRDIEPGEEVFSYGQDGQIRRSKVTKKWHNGTDQIYQVRSAHRDLYANATHPVLVEVIERHGKGRPRTQRVEYVEVQNLVPGKHRLVTPRREGGEEIVLQKPNLIRKARLRADAVGVVKRKVGLLKLQRGVGMQAHRIKAFFKGEYEVVEHTADALMVANGYGPWTLDRTDHWGGGKGGGSSRTLDFQIPDVVDEDFARWFGFMIGDGFVSVKRDKKAGHVKYAKVGFALGDDEICNQRYRKLFQKYVGDHLVKSGDSGHRLGSYNVSSTPLAEFMMMNGYIPGAHNKRIPGWVFRAAESIRMAFLKGLFDADGNHQPMTVSPVRGRVRYERWILEMCNRALVEDVRDLCLQLGLKTGRVTSRFRKGGRTIKGSTKPLKDNWYYTIHVSQDLMPVSEEIESIEPVGTDDIYDIEVSDVEHNFVADGVVVHNSRAPSRYAFYVDVGEYDNERGLAFVNRVKNTFIKKKFMNPNTNKLDMRHNPLCLAGDTEVRLLDGSVRSIEEMVSAYSRGDEQWVWGTDLNDGGRARPVKVEWAGPTRRAAQLVRVVLDNGRSVRVTPDHKMIRRNGERAEAQHLSPGDSLMPFRRRVSSKDKGETLDGYELIYCPKAMKSQYGHRIVAKDLGLTQAGQLTHHRDFDPLNNDPRNLEGMEPKKHRAYHVAMGHSGGRAMAAKRLADPGLDKKLRAASRRNMTKYNRSPEKRNKLSKWNRERDQGRFIRAYNSSSKHKADNEIRSQAMIEMWEDPDRRAKASANMMTKFPVSFVEGVRQLVRENPEMSMEGLSDAVPGVLLDELREANTKKIRSVHRHMLRKMVRHEGFDSFVDFKADALDDNCKVVSVEWLDEPEDTFTLTVAPCHTFALEAGVFVCNSHDEDFWIPTRGGKDSTRVEVGHSVRPHRHEDSAGDSHGHAEGPPSSSHR
jgi:intein/homing endonuclease